MSQNGDQLLTTDEGILTHLEQLTATDPFETAGYQIAIELEFKEANEACLANARTIISALLPHFHRAFRIQTETRGDTLSRTIATSLLDGCDGMLAILDSEGRIALSNEAFRAFIADGTGLDIDVSGGVIFEAAQNQHLFQQTLETAIASGRSGAFHCKFDGPDPVLISLTPLRHSDPMTGPLILFGVRNSQPKRPSLQILQTLYGLTRAEIRVTELVVQGATIEEAAREIGVSKITARNQLTSAMSKLGVGRQAHLVSLVLNLCPKLPG